MKQFRWKLEKQLLGKMPDDKLALLPSGFQRIGDIIILNLKPGLERFDGKIGKAVLKTYPDAKTVCAKSGAIGGELRVPQIRRIAGNGTETVHTENRCRYRLDVAKVMFAKGNARERGRLPGLVNPGEVVVDMFAGIGYFTIPIARHAKPAEIHAIEKNPDAAEFLKENVKMNRASNTEIEIRENDNRKVKLPGIADRVIMGYFYKNNPVDNFLPVAFNFLKPKGGVIHYHNIFKRDELWNKPFGILERAGSKYGYVFNRGSFRKVVKEYSPGMVHVVVDANFTKSLKS